MGIVVHDDLADPGATWPLPGLSEGLTDFAGHLVMDVRAHIQREPRKGGVVSEAGGQALATLGKIAFPPDLRKMLKQMKAEGRDHLCIIPHRALHFCPMHLATIDDGRAVADDWSVSYAPQPAVLAAAGSGAAEAEVEAFGVSFSDRPAGLRPLPETITEASAIAKLWKTAPKLDQQASKRAVLAALANAKRVHIASHGQHNVEAPAFQCIFLDRGESLYAHEVLGLDLRALDLVTLSACETALGRVDLSDNLRGLSANLLMRGAATIVGTLWPIETKASLMFFTAFYRELAQGADKLAAFRVAQVETRRNHPEFRDWGAFYFSGAWHPVSPDA
jgi:CHAT domain-containing protein